MSETANIWTPDQVRALNDFQRAGNMHPFTCETAHPDGRDLVATVKGWICPYCDYRQNWAHDFMFKGAGPSPLAVIRASRQESEIAGLKTVIANLLKHSGIADAAPEDKDGVDHQYESAALVAIS